MGAAGFFLFFTAEASLKCALQCSPVEYTEKHLVKHVALSKILILSWRHCHLGNLESVWQMDWERLAVAAAFGTESQIRSSNVQTWLLLYTPDLGSNTFLSLSQGASTLQSSSPPTPTPSPSIVPPFLPSFVFCCGAICVSGEATFILLTLKIWLSGNSSCSFYISMIRSIKCTA